MRSMDGLEFRAYGTDVVRDIRAPHGLCKNVS